MVMKTSANKMRAIVSWLDYQNEGLNDRFKSISDIEKAFDYCKQSNIVEYLDSTTMFNLDDEDYDLVVKEVTELLGYSIF